MKISWAVLLFLPFHLLGQSQQEKLFLAIDSLDYSKIEQAINAGADVNGLDQYQNTPLIRASFRGDLKLIDFLLENGAEVNYISPNTQTAIAAAINLKKKEVAEHLISKGAKVEYVANEAMGMTLLMSLLGRMYTDVSFLEYIKLLLENGADPSAVHPTLGSVLQQSFTYQNVNLTRVLLEAGADVHATDPYYGTLLHNTVYSGKYELAELLIRYKAPLNALNNQGQTPLMVAVQMMKPAMCSLLIQSGADISLKDMSGSTALEVAKRTQNQDLINAFKKDGSGVNKTVLQTERLLSAIQNLDTVVFREAIVKGANLSAEHPQLKYTPLDWCAISMRTEFAQELIAAGASVHHTDYEGATPIFKAVANGNLPLVKALFENGGKLDVKRNDGFTPIMLAASAGHVNVCRWLWRHGASLSDRNADGQNIREVLLSQVMGYSLRVLAFIEGPENYANNLLWLTNDVLLPVSDLKSDFTQASNNEIDRLRGNLKGASANDRWKDIGQLGEIYFHLGEFTAAETMYRQEREEFPKQGMTFLYYADLLIYLARFEEASKLLAEAANVLGDSHPSWWAVNIHLMVERGDFAQAMKSYSKHEVLFPSSEENVPENYFLWKMYQSLGDAQTQYQSIVKASDFHRKMHGVSHLTPGFSLDYLLPYYNAQVLNSTISGQDDNFVTVHFEKNVLLALGHEFKLHDSAHPEVLKKLLKLGEIFYLRGDYAAADLVWAEVGNRAESALGRTHPFYGKVVRSRAMLFKSVGNFESAKSFLDEALGVFKGTFGENHPDYAKTLHQLGIYYRLIRQFEVAIECFDNEFRILESTIGIKTLNGAECLNQKGIVYFLMEQFDEAMMNLNQANKLYNEATISDLKNPVYQGNLGMVHQTMGNSQSAIQLYELASNSWLGEDLKNHHTVQYTVNASKLYLDLKDTESASKKAIEALEAHQERLIKSFPTMSEKEKELYYNHLSADFDYLNFVLLEGAIQSEELRKKLFDNQLQTKALILSATLAVRDRIAQSSDIQLKKDYDEWRELREQLAILKPRTDVNNVKEVNELKLLEAEATQLEKELTIASADFKTVFESKQPNWLDVQKTLKPEEVVVEIIRSEYKGIVRYGALIVREGAKAPELVILPESERLDSRYLNYYRNAIRSKTEDEFSYDVFWKPIAEKLGRVKRVYFSPDGVYNQINLKTLRNPTVGSYVADDFELKLVTTSRELTMKDFGARNSGDPVLLGRPEYEFEGLPDEVNPDSTELTRGALRTYFRGGSFADLPGTEKEVTAIKKVLDDLGVRTSLLMGDEASEKYVKSLANPRILHLATHGFFIPDDSDDESDLMLESLLGESFHVNANSDPMLRSGLVLAGASNYLKGQNIGGEDGLLTAFEVVKMDLRGTDLVVLSACETGLGEIRSGQGVYGLQRAIKVAGAKSILMSLWKVSDEATQELMTHFYAELAKTNDVGQAFDIAQGLLRTKFPHPYYWGAFVLVGG